MKIGTIVQARMGSTRLPGKVMMELCGRPVIEHVVERLNKSLHTDMIVMATTTLPQDNVIAAEAQRMKVTIFRGSEEDVLSRYYLAAKENHLDVIVRVTSDCPLIDPYMIDDLIERFTEGAYDLVTNVNIDVSQRTFPRGLDAEVFSFRILEEAYRCATEKYQREHVTPYIYEHGQTLYFHKNDVNYSKYRWTLDTEEDFLLIQAVYQRLYHGQHDFYFYDILKLFDRSPELADMNAHIEQKIIKP